MLAGGLVGGALAEVTDLQIAVLAALVPFALALPLLILMQEPPRDLRHKGRAGIARTLVSGLNTVWRSAELRSVLLLEVALTGTFPAFFLLAQPFLDAHGVSLALFGVLAIPVHLARTAAGLVSGRVARRIGLSATLAGSLAGAVGGLLLLAVVDSVFAFAGLAIAMASVSIALPVIGAYVNDRTESDVRATVLSVAPMGTSIMMATASLTAGVIADQSLRLAFGTLAIIILLVGGLNFLNWLGIAKTLRHAEIDLVEA